MIKFWNLHYVVAVISICNLMFHKIRRWDTVESLHFSNVLYECMEKAMATHSSILAWKIPRMEEPGRLQSMGSLRVRQDWATSLSLFTFMHWRRKWQSIPVFLPGESQGLGGPGGLPSIGSHRVGHDWSDLAVAAAAYICKLQICPEFKVNSSISKFLKY